MSVARDPSVGHAGGPTVILFKTQSNIEFKLVDIPEFGFTHHDRDQMGRPCPRGELYLRGPAVFSGYYG
jgi:long-chain acyl-CoA synthetase